MFSLQNRFYVLVIVSILLTSFSITLIPSVAATSVTTTSNYEVATAGDTVSYVLSIGGVIGPVQNFTLSASGLPTGWSASFFDGNQQINSINIQGSETATITMKVSTLPNASSGTYDFSFVTTGGSNGEAVYPLQLELLPLQEGIQMTSSYPSVAADVGQPITYPVTITNAGETGEYINLNATTPSGWTFSFQASDGKSIEALYLNAGESQQFTFVATPSSVETTGAATFTVNATSADGSATSSLQLSADVSQVRDVQLTCAYPHVSQQEGQSVSFPITLSNEGTSGELLNLSYVAPAGWTASYTGAGLGGTELNSIYLAAGNSQSLTFEVTPASTEALGNASFTLVAVSSDGEVNSSLGLLVSVVPPSGEINLLSTFTVMTANVGSSLSFPLTIENTRSIDTTLNLTATVPDGWSAVFMSGNNEVSSVSLTSQQSINLDLVVTAPSTVNIGNYPIDIIVNSSDGTVNQQLSLTADLLGSYSLTATPEAYSTQVSSGGSTSMAVTVANTGESPVTSIKLDVTLPDSTWSETTSPIEIQSLAPGDSTTVTLQLTNPSSTVAGDYLVSVSAAGDQVSSSSFQIRVTVNASTSWIYVGLLIAIIAVIAVALMFRKYGRR
jgi:uncharacterized membrane protein